MSKKPRYARRNAQGMRIVKEPAGAVERVSDRGGCTLGGPRGSPRTGARPERACGNVPCLVLGHVKIRHPREHTESNEDFADSFSELALHASRPVTPQEKATGDDQREARWATSAHPT
jgi:hypothetical protein